VELLLSLRDDHGLFVWMLNLMGYDLFTSFATVAACINNMGLGFGERHRRSAR
jgi:Trk-type K+ transport system membrane component